MNKSLKNNPQEFILRAPFGAVQILVNDETLLGLQFKTKVSVSSRITHPFARIVRDELEHYFANPKHKFALDLELSGTPFQQKVWYALAQIRSGEVLTYGALAKQLQSAPRAIGQTCKRNPVAIIVPCHRIVGANNIGGFAGKKSGAIFQIKQWLLTHEHAANY